MSERLWLNEIEVAHVLGVTRETLWRWRRRKMPPAYYRLHGRIWYRPDDVTAFIEAGRNA